MQDWIIENPEELSTIVEFLKKWFPQGATLLMSGELGAGKTTLVRTFLHSLDKSLKVISPSFVLRQSYQTHPPVEHFDLYRLTQSGFDDLVELGYYEAQEMCLSRNGFVFVEWPEKITQINLLQAKARLTFTFENGKRRIHLTSV